MTAAGNSRQPRHHPDGTVHPGPLAGQFLDYGPGLAALRSMLRRKYGQNVRIIETWKA